MDIYWWNFVMVVLYLFHIGMIKYIQQFFWLKQLRTQTELRHNLFNSKMYKEGFKQV